VDGGGSGKGGRFDRGKWVPNCEGGGGDFRLEPAIEYRIGTANGTKTEERGNQGGGGGGLKNVFKKKRGREASRGGGTEEGGTDNEGGGGRGRGGKK